MSLSKKPSYKHGPVQTLTTLAEILDLTEAQLDKLATNADRMYRFRPQKKKDGSLRETWDAFPQLKNVHDLINRRFLRQVTYPLYLQGGIRDKQNPRDYVRNVNIHAGAACVITLDIADFFPSIQRHRILSVWRDFFRFSNDVAETLTALTTKDGVLPQGAKTSSYLANLVFWDTEHELVDCFERQGWTYSRLTDDITISKKTIPSDTETTRIVTLAVSFIQRNGYDIKREKQKILRGNQRMEINGLIANRRPALPKKERNRIRAQVNTLARKLADAEDIDLHFIRSTFGKLDKLRRLHPQEAKQLETRLPADLRTQKHPAGYAFG
jgi:retron-type reverse transcriptase